MRGIDDLIGDLVASVGGEAMHEDCVGLGMVEQLGVDLVREKYLAALFRFGFLAHAGPDVGVNDVGAGGGGNGIVGNGARA